MARPLRILHISTADNSGGAARSTYRLHLGLQKLGHESRLLVRWKVTDDPLVRRIGCSLPDRVCAKIGELSGLQYLFYPSSFLLPLDPWFKWADIIQLHNVHGNFFSHTSLPLLSRLKPVIWWFHDMWPMTGHCAYAYDCEEWKRGCRGCSCALTEYPPLRLNTSPLLWKIKKWAYDRSRLFIVPPSHWLEGVIAQSPLLNRFPRKIIPYGLDINVFRPWPKAMARQKWGLNPKGKIISFCAFNIDNPRKGGTFLKEALKKLSVKNPGELTLLTVGERNEEWKPIGPIAVRHLGTISSDEELGSLFSACDLFVLPTLGDNPPHVVRESMACGTPVVSFNVGGVPELLRHMETGYLAQHKDSEDLARGIQLLLEQDELRARMGAKCRENAEREQSIELHCRRFSDLYQEILS